MAKDDHDINDDSIQEDQNEQDFDGSMGGDDSKVSYTLGGDLDIDDGSVKESDMSLDELEEYQEIDEEDDDLGKSKSSRSLAGSDDIDEYLKGSLKDKDDFLYNSSEDSDGWPADLE